MTGKKNASKDIVKAYGLLHRPIIYIIHSERLTLQRIDLNRVVFTMIADDTDSDELWVSLSPTELRLFPRNREDYTKDTIFTRPLSEYGHGEKHHPIVCSYYRHKEFYRWLTECWSDYRTCAPRENTVSIIKHGANIKYRFMMAGCLHEQIYEHLLAIYFDVVNRADKNESDYKKYDQREGERRRKRARIIRYNDSDGRHVWTPDTDIVSLTDEGLKDYFRAVMGGSSGGGEVWSIKIDYQYGRVNQ